MLCVTEEQIFLSEINRSSRHSLSKQALSTRLRIIRLLVFRRPDVRVNSIVGLTIK